MKCPNDNATLVMSERNGVEIDYCPDCRGVWLDRGELDKIIDRAGGMAVPQRERPYPERGRGDDDRGYQRPRRRENWLSELFD